ncbi:MAG: PorT family protein [Bacteroidales bacterium]|nr:PorT family protein [Bacteroidales bacterium]
MKKLILLTTAILIGNLAFSQVLPGFSIGPKVGASFSKFTTDKEQIQEEIENSFFFGAFVRFGEKFYIQPELLVMKREGYLKNDALSGSSGSIKVSSVDIPVLVGFRIVNMKVANVRAMAGPVFSIAVDKTITTENWDDAITTDDIKNSNVGLQFGAGVDVLFLTLDLRYEIGLSDFSEVESFSLKNNMFTIGLGWKIL